MSEASSEARLDQPGQTFQPSSEYFKYKALSEATNKLRYVCQ